MRLALLIAQTVELSEQQFEMLGIVSRATLCRFDQDSALTKLEIHIQSGCDFLGQLIVPGCKSIGEGKDGVLIAADLGKLELSGPVVVVDIRHVDFAPFGRTRFPKPEDSPNLVVAVF